MNLQIDNRLRRSGLDRKALRHLAEVLHRLAFHREPADGWSGITIVLTDDCGIQTYKEAAFGYREVTDVVTLRYAPSPADPGAEGEIFVNVQRAISRPCRPGWSPAHELALYIAHGLDHLTGADDHTPEEHRRMRRRELRWLRNPACRVAIAALTVAMTGGAAPDYEDALKRLIPESRHPAVDLLANYAATGSEADAADVIANALAAHRLADLLAKLEQEDMRIRPAELAKVTEQVWAKYVQEITGDEQRQAEQEDKAIRYDGLTMRYAYKVVGNKPGRGYPLYIALHGGGEAPAGLNDSQWEHMKVYYLGGVTNGIYLATRGVTDNWNLHWREQSFACYDRLIENMIAFGQVDPDRVYLMGFSAGGDALYQIPARMPDRWAAAAMSAGHPNGVPPDNYANLGFLIQVGEKDGACKRNQVAAEYGVRLDTLQAAHPGLYRHATYIHAGRGHNFLDHGPVDLRQRVFTDPAAWLEQGSQAPTGEIDCNSIRWLDQHVRNPLPHKLIWDGDTRAERSGNKQPGFWPTAEKANLHYWIGIDRHDRDSPLAAQRIVVESVPQQRLIIVHEIGNFVRFYLHPAMFAPGQPVTVEVDGKTLNARPEPSLRTLVQSVLDRGDPAFAFAACLTLSRNPEGTWMLE